MIPRYEGKEIVNKETFLRVWLLRILALIALITGIVLEILGYETVVEGVVAAFGLFIINELRNVARETRQEIKGLGEEIRGEIGQLGQEIRGGIGQLGQEIRGEIGQLRQEIRGGIGQLGQEIRGE